MQSGILILHVLVCVVLVLLILLQSGREGMGVIFGGGNNSSVFGSQGAGGVLVKLTTFLAILFVVTSLGYNVLTSSKNNVKSVLDVQFEETAPTNPAPVSMKKAKEEPKKAGSISDQTNTEVKQEQAKLEEKPIASEEKTVEKTSEDKKVNKEETKTPEEKSTDKKENKTTSAK